MIFATARGIVRPVSRLARTVEPSTAAGHDFAERQVQGWPSRVMFVAFVQRADRAARRQCRMATQG
jgi:hypothetical protein